MRSVMKFAAVGFAAVGLAAGAAWAQQAPPGAPQGRPGFDQRGPGCMLQNGRLTEMLSRAHWRLRITPEEDAAWNKMSTDLTTALQPLAQQCGQRPQPVATLPDRLAQMAQFGQVHEQVIAAVQSAVTPMYNQLSADQKAEADRMLRPHGHRGPHEGMMHRP